MSNDTIPSFSATPPIATGHCWLTPTDPPGTWTSDNDTLLTWSASLILDEVDRPIGLHYTLNIPADIQANYNLHDADWVKQFRELFNEPYASLLTITIHHTSSPDRNRTHR